MKAIKIQNQIVPYDIVYGKYKGISMKYEPKQQQLIIKCSRWVSNAKIEEFVKKRSDWILKQVSKPWKFVHIGQTIDVFGINYPVKVVLSKKDEVVLTDVCTVYTTRKLTYEDVEKRLRSFLKEVLFTYINKIYPKVVERTNVDQVKFRYRYMTSRFGVCYPKRKEICLNAYLACFSKKAICAVLLHEFTHFYQANHSKKFYETLSQLYPTYEEDMLELKYVVLK